jgi:hypothetical protein
MVALDIKKCPVCMSDDVTDNICQFCGYNNSMEQKFQYTLTLGAHTNGTVEGEYPILDEDFTTLDKVPLGTELILTATPDSDYLFSKWTIGGIDYTDNPITITVEASVTIVAVFVAEKVLTIGTITNGIVKMDGVEVVADDYSFAVNTEVVLEAVPNAGYEFTRWDIGNGPVTDNPVIVTMDADYSYTPVFTLTATKGSGQATIEAESLYVVVTHGLSVIPALEKIRITPLDSIGNKGIFPSDTGATTFRINLGSTDAVPHLVGWSYED